MSLLDLRKKRGSRVLGIDCSTHSLAWAVFEGKQLLYVGEVDFPQKNLFNRLGFAHDIVTVLNRTKNEGGHTLFQADYVAMEAAIAVGNNVQTAISLAYVYGAVMGSIIKQGMNVVTVTPVTWQSYLGNPNLKPAEKLLIKKNFPGKSESWYKAEGRRMRKQRTLDIVREKFGPDLIHDNSDNASDAIGVAWYAVNNRTD